MPISRKKRASATLGNTGVKKSQPSSKSRTPPAKKRFVEDSELLEEPELSKVLDSEEDSETVAPTTIAAKPWVVPPPRETIYPPPPPDVAKKLAKKAQEHQDSIGSWYEKLSAKRLQEVADEITKYSKKAQRSTKQVPTEEELDEEYWEEQGEAEVNVELPTDAEILALADKDEELEQALKDVVGESALRSSNLSLPPLNSLPPELLMEVVKSIITHWKSRDMDLYTTMHMIRDTPLLSNAFRLIPNVIKATLPSNSREERIRSFIEVHCNFTPNQLNPYFYKISTLWEGGLMPCLRATRANYPDSLSKGQKDEMEICCKWFRIVLYMFDGNNLASMHRFLLRDIWACNRELVKLERKLPVPPRDDCPVPSIGRCLSMGMIDTWLNLFHPDTTPRQYREDRRRLWRRDELEPSLSTRITSIRGERHTVHAAAYLHSIALTCLYESRAPYRYRHLNFDPYSANGPSMVNMWSDINYNNWLLYVREGAQ